METVLEEMNGPAHLYKDLKRRKGELMTRSLWAGVKLSKDRPRVEAFLNKMLDQHLRLSATVSYMYSINQEMEAKSVKNS